jgi:hypothetical protein
MLRQRLALGPRALRDRRRALLGFRLGHFFGGAGLQLFEPKLELLDAPVDPLRGAAELHAAQAGDLELELLDLQAAQLHRELRRLELGLACQREGAQRFGIGGQVGRGERHHRP